MNLSELVKTDAGQTVLKVFADRQRQRASTNLKLFHKALSEDGRIMPYSTLVEIFRTLEANGAGELIIGRNSKNDRFEWAVNLKEYTKLVLAGKSVNIMGLSKPAKKQITVIKKKPTKKASVKKVAKKAKEESHSLTFEFPADTPRKDIEAFKQLAEGLKARSA